MFIVVVVLALVAESLSQICCVPPQWEGSQGTIIAVSRADLAEPMVVTGGIAVAYDAINKRVGAYMTMIVGEYNTSVGIILNYAEGVQYTISGNNCTRTALKPFAPNCIPSDAKLIRSGYMGPPSNKMKINTYKYMKWNLEIEASVTAETCVPVGEMVHGQAGNEYVVQSVGFSGITAGIKSTTSFTPPTSCMNSPIVQVNMNPAMSNLLRRYSSLFP